MLDHCIYTARSKDTTKHLKQLHNAIYFCTDVRPCIYSYVQLVGLINPAHIMVQSQNTLLHILLPILHISWLFLNTKAWSCSLKKKTLCILFFNWNIRLNIQKYDYYICYQLIVYSIMTNYSNGNLLTISTIAKSINTFCNPKFCQHHKHLRYHKVEIDLHLWQ